MSTTEYWLQKKGLSGWSMVTWYLDLEQAKVNYDRAKGKGDSGYSWRLVKVEVIEVSMLEEVTEIEAPELEIKKTTWGADIQKPKSNGWNDVAKQQTINDVWGSEPLAEPKWAVPSDSSASGGNKPEHSLTGSVWVVHHGLKEKKRVAANELDAMLAQGYERGGPKTKFRE